MDKKGYLVNDSTSKTEYFVLRSGLLRVYVDSTTCKVKNSIHLAFCSEVNLLPGAIIEIRAHAPFVWEYVLVAPTEAEAESWYTTLQRSISQEQESIHRNVDTLKLGAPLFKYNYSNSKRTRRVFWISAEGNELCWARKRDDADFSKVDLKECIGLIYGPMTTTFVRCEKIDDPGWCCFSLLFMGRTLDLATPDGEAMIAPWFLGLQFLVSSTTPMMGGSQFVVRKAVLKLTDAAHAQKLTLRTFLAQQIRKTRPRKDTQDRRRRWPACSPSSCSPLPSPSRPLKPDSWPLPSAVSNGRPNVHDEQLKDRIFVLEGELREAKLTAALASISSDPKNDDWESVAVKFLREECTKRDETIIKQTEKVNQYDALRAKSEKMEKALRKMAKALEKGEKNKSVETNDVGSTKLDSPTEIRQTPSLLLDHTAEQQLGERTHATSQHREHDQAASQQLEKQAEQLRDQNRQIQAQNQAFKQQIADLEAKLRSASASSKETAETLQKESEKREHHIDGLRAEIARLQKAEHAALERNRKVHNARATILNATKQLSNSVRELKKAQRTLRAEAEERIRRELSGSNAGFAQIFDALSKLNAQKDAFAAKLKSVSEERRKLHNLVAELKGNIRVFCRVRPIIAREHADEPANANTVSFSEDTKVTIYNDYDARKKGFEFDQIFHPSATQIDVFEEAYPLATSVLDGYNICIFAYGQTGSGKTFTMTGPKTDPGLNVRILRELFTLREKKKASSEIHVYLSILEIYNESIRDLLGAQAKVLEIKATDSQVTVPGLEEKEVNSQDDVLTFMAMADSIRASSTTDMNERSSRSHSIVTVRTHHKSFDTGLIYNGKVHLIDLAGSENVSKSGVIGARLTEAQNINKSLSALGDVMQSLQQSKSGHIPYRNSKLTMLLKDSLGGNSKTLMIVHISPAQCNVIETLSSLNFASRARQVELGKAKKNVSTS